MSALVDANILVRISDTDSVLHDVCKAAIARLDSRSSGLFLCTQVAAEFWAVATRPRASNGLELEPVKAETELRDFERAIDWLPDPPDLGLRWLRIVTQYQVRGRQAHDAKLVAFMQAHGLTEILTLNAADFARYDGIRCILPGDVR